MAKCDHVLRTIGTKVKVVIEIDFLSNLGDKVWSEVIRCGKMW